jgi:hypothetical protein
VTDQDGARSARLVDPRSPPVARAMPFAVCDIVGLCAPPIRARRPPSAADDICIKRAYTHNWKYFERDRGFVDDDQKFGPLAVLAV